MIWTKLIKEGVRSSVGMLPAAYRDTGKIKDIKDIKTITVWLNEYELWSKKINALGLDKWQFPGDLKKEDVLQDIKDNFKKSAISSGVGPEGFKRLLVDRKLYLGERDLLMKKCDQKTD